MTAIPNTFLPGYRLIDGSQLNANFAAASQGIGAGVSYYVDATNGADANNGGQNPSSPLATLSAAVALETTALSSLGLSSVGRGSTIYLAGTVHETATVAWGLPGTNLVGLSAPSVNNRSRISSTGATPFSPLVNVTVGGCQFINIGTFHGGFTSATGSQVCWNDAGGRNYYSNTQFLGGGDATTAALAGMRSLTITGVGENLFDGCTVGLDTIIRATNANASMELLSGTARNVMRGCVFRSYISDVSDVHITIGAGGMDRDLLLDGCSFLNFGSTMSAAITNAGGSPGGNVVLTPTCISVGATAVGTTGNIFVAGAVPTANTSNIGILAT